MKNLATHLAVAAAALTAGGLATTAITAPTKTATAASAQTAAEPAEQVRTQTVTRVIHRVRRVHVRPKPHAVAAAPSRAPAPPAPRVTVAPAPVAPAPRVQTAAPIRVPVAHSAPARSSKPTLHTRTSGTAAGGSGEHEDGGEREGGGDD